MESYVKTVKGSKGVLSCIQPCQPETVLDGLLKHAPQLDVHIKTTDTKKNTLAGK